MLRYSVIQSFSHRGLKRLYEQGDVSKIRPDLLLRVKDIVTRLDNAAEPRALNLPGYGLHRLTGNLKGLWSVTVSRNYRIVFRFNKGNAYDVDLIDYH